MDTSPNRAGLFQEEEQGPFVYCSYEDLLLREVFYFDQCCDTELPH